MEHRKQKLGRIRKDNSKKRKKYLTEDDTTLLKSIRKHVHCADYNTNGTVSVQFVKYGQFYTYRSVEYAYRRIIENITVASKTKKKAQKGKQKGKRKGTQGVPDTANEFVQKCLDEKLPY